jgi:hypothetical protein
MATVKIIDDENFENGILRDGHTVRMPMLMKDSSTLTPVEKAIAATKLAMESFDSAMHDSHRPGFRRAATGTADSAAHQSTRFGVYDGVREAAYSAADRATADAWRGSTDKSPPAGAYPASDADEGDVCTVDGRPGTLCAIPGHDGYLECIADDDGNTGDSRTRYYAKSAQQTKDAAYSSYQNEIENAWKRK